MANRVYRAAAVAAVVMVAAAVLALGAGCGGGGGGGAGKASRGGGGGGGAPGAAAAAEAGKAAAEVPGSPEKRPDDGDPEPRVALETSLGTIVLALDRKRAPITVENFLRYVAEGFYDGTIFHRIRPDFMIQAGGYDERKQSLEPGRDPIRNESEGGLSNVPGTVAMARFGEPDTARAQFFINVADNSAKLDFPRARGHGYAVFGRVVEGMDVVETIRRVPIEEHSRRLPHCPVENVVVTKARRL